MEAIHKTINLSNIKCRFDCTTPTVKNEEGGVSAYGEIPKNFKIRDGNILKDLEKNLPLSEYFLEKNENGDIVYTKSEGVRVLSYETLLTTYTWLKNYIRNCVFYKICKRNDKIVPVKYPKVDFFEGDYIEGYDNIEQEWEESQIGEIYYENVNAKIFEKKFKDTRKNSGAVYAKALYDFADNVITNTGTTYSIEEYTIPSISVPIYIEEEYDDLGILENTAEFWNPNKRYFLGDTSLKFVEGKLGSYVLISGLTGYEQIQITGILLEEVRDAVEEFDHKEIVTTLPQIGDKNLIWHNGENYFFIYPYAEGNSDSVWRKIEEETVTAQTVVGETASKLSTLKRYKSPYNSSGVTYPFILNGGNAELLYLPMAPINSRINDGEPICDYISGIKINGAPKTVSAGTPITADSLPSGDSITFVYSIGCKITDDGVDTDNTVTYEETYPFEKKIIEIEQEEIEYIDIDYGSKKDGKIIPSSIKYNEKGDEALNGVFTYKNDDMIGVQNVSESIDATITRGVSAAFERHAILGEINSLYELENYKNDYFGLRN